MTPLVTSTIERTIAAGDLPVGVTPADFVAVHILVGSVLDADVVSHHTCWCRALAVALAGLRRAELAGDPPGDDLVVLLNKTGQPLTKRSPVQPSVGEIRGPRRSLVHEHWDPHSCRDSTPAQVLRYVDDNSLGLIRHIAGRLLVERGVCDRSADLEQPAGGVVEPDEDLQLEKFAHVAGDREVAAEPAACELEMRPREAIVEGAGHPCDRADRWAGCVESGQGRLAGGGGEPRQRRADAARPVAGDACGDRAFPTIAMLAALDRGRGDESHEQRHHCDGAERPS